MVILNSTVSDLIHRIEQNGLNKLIINEISHLFLKNIQELDSELLLQLIKHLLSYKGEIIFVVEILQFLKKNSKDLEIEYLKHFTELREKKINTVVTDVDKEEEVGEKHKNKKRRVKKNIKKRSKDLATNKYREKLKKKNKQKQIYEENEKYMKKYTI